MGGGAVGVQRRASDLQELQVQVVVNRFTCVLGTELGSPARTPCTIISLALVLTIFVAVPNFSSPLSLFAKFQLCVSRLELPSLLEDCCFHLGMQYAQ